MIKIDNDLLAKIINRNIIHRKSLQAFQISEGSHDHLRLKFSHALATFKHLKPFFHKKMPAPKICLYGLAAAKRLAAPGALDPRLSTNGAELFRKPILFLFFHFDPRLSTIGAEASFSHSTICLVLMFLMLNTQKDLSQMIDPRLSTIGAELFRKPIVFFFHF